LLNIKLLIFAGAKVWEFGIGSEGEVRFRFGEFRGGEGRRGRGEGRRMNLEGRG
jgi:hypothetical protein